MKKILCTGVLALILLGLTACGGKKQVDYNVTEGNGDKLLSLDNF